MALTGIQILKMLPKKYKSHVVALEHLIPKFLDDIPELQGGFYLEWSLPTLHLMREGDR